MSKTRQWKKRARDWKYNFTEQEIRMTLKSVKRYYASLVIREMKVRTITRWHILYLIDGNKKCVTKTIIDEDVKRRSIFSYCR